MLVVVGGHTRNIGKTSVVCSIIRSTRHLGWTAIKITQYGHGVCSKDGESCECALPDHPFALQQELDATARTDTSRFLAAGAGKSYWARTAAGNLGEALPALRRLWESNRNTVIESNSILQFVKPDLYLAVLDFGVKDFKDSSRRHLDRADAIVAVSTAPAVWTGVAESLWRDKPIFTVSPPDYTHPGLAALLAGATGQSIRRAGARPLS
jgi:hypothetical protein